MRHIARFFVVVLLTLSLSPVHAQVSVWTYHNDNGRTGQNTNETILTTANVNTNSFGKLFSFTADGFIYAQPLYIPNVAITNKGTHNVVFICSEGDTVYALDADNNTGSNATPLWQKSMLGAGETTVGTNIVATTDVTPKIGITGTPVIDTNTGTIYLVAKSQLVSGATTNFIQRLHALDITSGNEQSNSPVLIQATVPGTGEGTDGAGHLAFDPLKQHQRSALLLLNGTIYIIWASHGDNSPYHGWVMGYNETTLAQTSVFNTTPNGVKGGIWHAGCGPVADTNGNLYFVTGNGTYDGTTNNDYGDTIIRLSTTNAATNLFLADYFTPYNQFALGGPGNDTDLGSGGAMLLPDSVGSAAHRHLLVDAGKGRTIYLVDTTNMGHYNAVTANDNQIVQSISNAVGGVVLSTPAYFNNRVYYMSYKDVVKAFSISNGVLSTSPISQSTLVSGIFGATPTITANGTNNAIVWIVLVDQYKVPTAAAVLHAYDAYNLTTELYNSSQAGTRDQPIGPVKFVVPTVVNGKVYVGTQTGVVVFGNQSFTAAPLITAQPQSQSVAPGVNATFSVGVQASNAVVCSWYFDGNLIPGVTSTNYTVTNVQAANAGYYYVVVSNQFGSTLTATSTSAYLSVVSPLTNNPGAILAPAGLVDWWPADGNALDIFGGNNGILQAGAAYAPGESGLAFSFNGTTSYVNVGASNLPAPWTASFWVNRQNGLTNSTILMGDSTYYLKLEQYNNSHQVGITQLSYLDSSFSYIVPTNTWTHLAFVTTPTSVTLYANGVSQGSITTNNFPLPRSYIGAGFAPSRFVDFVLGNVDEIMVFNRALAVNEVSSIYSAGPAGLIRAPLFSKVAQTNGQFTLGVEGLTGRTITISTSTNLTTWTPVVTLPNATGSNSYSEAITNGVTKFYRLTQP